MRQPMDNAHMRCGRHHDKPTRYLPLRNSFAIAIDLLWNLDVFSSPVFP